MTYVDRLPRELQDLLERYRSSPGYRIKVETCARVICVRISSPEFIVTIRLFCNHPNGYMADFFSGRYPRYFTDTDPLTLRGDYLSHGETMIKLSPELKDALIEAEGRTQSLQY